MACRRARARSPNAWYQSRRLSPAAGRCSASWEPHAVQPAGLPAAGRWYHAPQRRQTGSSPSGPSPCCQGLASVGGASRKRLLRTLARARTWGGAGSGSRHQSPQRPRDADPLGEVDGESVPPRPAAGRAGRVGSRSLGRPHRRRRQEHSWVLGGLLCPGVTRAMPWGSPGAAGQVAAGISWAAATWPQGLGAGREENCSARGGVT